MHSANYTILQLVEIRSVRDAERSVEHLLRLYEYAKATGSDALFSEILKCLGDGDLYFLHRTCHKVWFTGVWPGEWTNSIFVPLYNMRSPANPLISHSSKVLLYRVFIN